MTTAGTSESQRRDRRRVRVTAALSGGLIAAMLGLTAAAVPLYDLFCRVTGYGGTTQRAEVAPGTSLGPTIAITFNADTAPDLAWRFRPAQHAMQVAAGEQHLAFYEAENLTDQPVVGRAIYNVTPHKVGSYFAKLACFCFEEQTLEPGQKVAMPVSFFVDPAIAADPATQEVRQITLSYTFFIDARATTALRQERAAQAHGDKRAIKPQG